MLEKISTRDFLIGGTGLVCLGIFIFVISSLVNSEKTNLIYGGASIVFGVLLLINGIYKISKGESWKYEEKATSTVLFSTSLFLGTLHRNPKVAAVILLALGILFIAISLFIIIFFVNFILPKFIWEILIFPVILLGLSALFIKIAIKELKSQQ